MSAVTATSIGSMLQKNLARGIRLLRSDQAGGTPWQIYVLAVVLTAATLALRLAVNDLLDGRPTMVILTVPIMLSAYLGGLRAGLLATALSMLGVSYRSLPPIHSFAVAAPAERWQLFFTAVAGLVISVSNEVLHRARRHADALNREHQRVTEALRGEREFLAALVENVADGIVSCDADGVISLFNRAMREFHGLPGDPIPADRWSEHFDLYLPDGETRMSKEQIPLFRALHEGSVRDLEMVIAPKEGRPRRVLCSGQAFYDASGRKAGAVVAMRDITERREAEVMVSRFSAIVESSQDAIVGKNLNSIVTSWNKGAERIFGYTAEEMVGTSIRRLIPEDRHGEEDHILSLIKRGQRVETFETLRLTKDKRLIHISVTVSPIKDSKGNVIGASKVARDITERRHVEEELSRSRETLDRVLNQIPQRVFWKDRELVYRGCNRAFALDMGFREPQEVIGKTDFDVSWKGVASLYRADDRAVMEANAPKTSFEEPRIAADGEAGWLRTSKAPLHDAQGNVIGVLGTYEDVTEHKRAKLEIERLNRHLEQRVAERTAALEEATLEAKRANSAKSEFLSRMSHELRTPMNAILGFAQVLETEKDLTADQRDSVDHIVQGGGHLLKLINEVLDMTSIESGRLTLSSEAIALPEILEETITLLRPLGAEFQVRLTIPPSEGAASHVQADRLRLKQVLLNLLGNAIKYNRPGGSVTVRYAISTDDPTRTRLAVTDTGAGLDAAKLSGLFQPFERLGAEQMKIEGTGLGLVLAKRMVEHMRGSIGVESVLGSGSTFWIELPTATPPAEPEEPTGEAVVDAPSAVSAERRVVLSIEDNPSNTRLIARILDRRPAIHLLTAETGARGLRLAREEHPDLILLDLHLPDSDGECVLQRLASDPSTAAIPVMVITADAIRGKRETLLAAGARAFLTKPLDVRTFLAAIDQLLAPAAV